MGLGAHPTHMEPLGLPRSVISLMSPKGKFGLPAECVCWLGRAWSTQWRWWLSLWFEGAGVTVLVTSLTTVTVVLDTAPHLPVTCSPWLNRLSALLPY